MVVTAFLCLAGAGGAAADNTHPGTIPGLPGGGIDLNPFDNLVNQMCSPKEPPEPQPPLHPIPMVKGVPENRQATVARYGYAGLFWTTYDQGCLSLKRLDTSTGSSLNEVSTSIDGMVNETQTMALDPNAGVPYDPMLKRAVGGVGDALFNPWLGVPLAAVGVIAAAAAAGGRVTALVAIVVNALVVLGVVTFVLHNPETVTGLSDGLTGKVAQRTSTSLIAATGGSAVPASQAVAEGYYRISRQAWIDGEFCGDEQVAAAYAPRLLDAQAFTVTQYNKVRNDEGAMRAAVKAKGDAWTAIAKELQTKHPAVYGCWKGSTQSRTGASIRHIVVSVCAGIPVGIAAMAVLMLKNMLRFGLLIAGALGLVMLMSRKVSSAALEFLVMCFAGSAMIAGGAGTLMFGYYAILSDPTQAWWSSVVAAFALGLAVLFSWKFLRRVMFSSAVDDVRSHGRHLRSRRSGSGGTRHHGGDSGRVPDSREQRDPPPRPGGPSPDTRRRQEPAPQSPPPPRRGPAPAPVNPSDPSPVREPVPVGAERKTMNGQQQSQSESRHGKPPAEAWPEEMPEPVRAKVADDLRHWSDAARARGRAPTGEVYQPPPVE